MAVTTKDELNILSNGDTTRDISTQRKGVPFSEYFGVMPISRDRLDRRINLADDLLEVMLLMYALIEQRPTKTLVKTQIYNEILTNVAKAGSIDKYVDDLAWQYSEDLTRVTFDHINTTSVIDVAMAEGEENYYTSIDRAMFVAEDMSQSFVNYMEYAENEGKTKIWHSQGDLRVRATHERVNNTKLPFDGIFKVGESDMRFPKDMSMGASAEEVINCRCYLTFE